VPWPTPHAGIGKAVHTDMQAEGPPGAALGCSMSSEFYSRHSLDVRTKMLGWGGMGDGSMFRSAGNV
jgi:hypothetical protein